MRYDHRLSQGVRLEGVLGRPLYEKDKGRLCSVIQILALCDVALCSRRSCVFTGIGL